MINRLHGEVEGHELYNRAQTTKGCADAKTGKAVLSDRCVHNAARAKLLKELPGDFVGALILGHLLTHDENGFVATHFFSHRVAQGVTKDCFCISRARRDIRIGQDWARWRI